MTSQTPEFALPCTECQAGQMRHVLVTYFTWLGDELITVPDFPAWRCDICGRREYDLTSLNQLSLLLNPNAGTPTHARPRAKAHKPKDKSQRPPKARD